MAEVAVSVEGQLVAAMCDALRRLLDGMGLRQWTVRGGDGATYCSGQHRYVQLGQRLVRNTITPGYAQMWHLAHARQELLDARVGDGYGLPRVKMILSRASERVTFDPESVTLDAAQVATMLALILVHEVAHITRRRLTGRRRAAFAGELPRWRRSGHGPHAPSFLEALRRLHATGAVDRIVVTYGLGPTVRRVLAAGARGCAWAAE